MKQQLSVKVAALPFRGTDLSILFRKGTPLLVVGIACSLFIYATDALQFDFSRFAGIFPSDEKVPSGRRRGMLGTSFHEDPFNLSTTAISRMHA